MKTTKEDKGEELAIEQLERLFPADTNSPRPFRFRFPFVSQPDEMDCGPACMAMISLFYGNDLPVPYWRTRMYASRDGTSLLDLAKAAQQAGFVCHGLWIEDLSILRPSLFPFIALRQYHYLVVYRAGKKGVLVGDPAVGIRLMAWSDFRDGFEGHVLMLKPTKPFYAEKAPERSYRHYLAMLRDRRLEWWLIIATSLILSLLETTPAFLAQFVLDYVLVPRNYLLLKLTLLSALAVTALMALVSWLRAYYLSFVTARFDFAAASAFIRKLLNLPYGFFAVRHVGDFTRRLAELERLRDFATSQFITIVLHLANLAVYGTLLFIYSPQIALAVFLGAPTLLAISLFFSRRLRRQYSEVFSAQAAQDGMVADLIKGIATIKALGAEAVARWRFEEGLVGTLRARRDLQLTSATLQSFSLFANQAFNIGVMGLAAWLALRNRMTPGQVVSVSIIAAGVAAPFNGLAWLWSEVQQMRTALDRLNDVYLTEPEILPGPLPEGKQRLRGEIEFRDVWFRYGGESSEWVLRGVSFRLAAGQRLAVIGKSGAGKSTLGLLTSRFYDPNRGQVLIDGRDCREYDRRWLRTQIGLLVQETPLFHGTILDNIAYSDAEADMGRVVRAVAIAGVEDVIDEKAGGYRHVLSHGGFTLSGGQKQRLVLARALYADPRILFLDEATSSLDARSEHGILKRIIDADKNRTLVNIAHRYSTVKLSDRVLVLDAGKIVEFGAPGDLLKRGGHYFKAFMADQRGTDGFR